MTIFGLLLCVVMSVGEDCVLWAEGDAATVVNEFRAREPAAPSEAHATPRFVVLVWDSAFAEALCDAGGRAVVDPDGALAFVSAVSEEAREVFPPLPGGLAALALTQTGGAIPFVRVDPPEWVASLLDGTWSAAILDIDIIYRWTGFEWSAATTHVGELLAAGRADEAVTFVEELWGASRNMIASVGVRGTTGVALWQMLVDADAPGLDEAIERSLQDVVDDIRRGALASPLSFGSPVKDLTVLARMGNRRGLLREMLARGDFDSAHVLARDQLFDALSEDDSLAASAAEVAVDLNAAVMRRLGGVVTALPKQLAALEANPDADPSAVDFARYERDKMADAARRLVRVAGLAHGEAAALEVARTCAQRSWIAAVGALGSLADLEAPDDIRDQFAQRIIERFDADLPEDARTAIGEAMAR